MNYTYSHGPFSAVGCGAFPFRPTPCQGTQQTNGSSDNPVPRLEENGLDGVAHNYVRTIGILASPDDSEPIPDGHKACPACAAGWWNNWRRDGETMHQSASWEALWTFFSARLLAWPLARSMSVETINLGKNAPCGSGWSGPMTLLSCAGLRRERLEEG